MTIYTLYDQVADLEDKAVFGCFFFIPIFWFFIVLIVLVLILILLKCAVKNKNQFSEIFNSIKFYQKFKDSSIYLTISAILITIILIRFLYKTPTSILDFSLDFREGIDEPTMILLGALIPILILWYYNKPIKELFDWMLGNAISILEKNINKCSTNESIQENSDFGETGKHNHPNNDYETMIVHITGRASNIQELLLVIGDEIEVRLKRCINLHEGQKGQNALYLVNIKELVDDVESRNIIDNRFNRIIIDFFELKNKVTNISYTKRLIEVGKKILKIIINNYYVFFKKITAQESKLKNSDIKINIANTNKEKEEYTIETDITIVDNNGIHEPLEYLDISHVTIKEEKNENDIRETHPQKVLYLGNKRTKFNLLLLIDDSRSMDGKNFSMVKNHTIKLIEILKKHKIFDTSIGITTLINPDNDSANSSLDKWYNLSSDYIEITNKIAAITLQGVKNNPPFHTPLYYSIDKCSKKMKEQEGTTNTEINLIVVLSDGKNFLGYGKKDYKEINVAVICPIKFIGYQWDPNDDSKIIKIVEDSGAGGKGLGYFCDVKNEELEQVFGNILQSVFKRYRITWTTYFPNDDNITRKMKVTYGGKESEIILK